MQETEKNLTKDVINLKAEINAKLDTKVDNVAWKDTLWCWACGKAIGDAAPPQRSGHLNA